MKKYLLASFAAVLLLGSSQVARADIASNLLLNYTLDDSAANTTVIDAAGHSNGTTAANTSALHAAGKIGTGSFAMNSAARLDINTNYTWAATDANMTMAAWVKFDGAAQAENIFGSYNGQNAYIQLGVTFQGYVTCSVRDSNGSAMGSTLLVKLANDGNWHHVACVINGTTVAAYLDGANAGTGQNSNVNGNFQGRSARTLMIAQAGNSSGYWGGSLDDVRVYNRALSSSDITELYNYTGATQQSSGPTSGTSELSGWAWSSNIGWISFNSNDSGTGNGGSGKSSVAYEVDLSTTTGSSYATFSGYAWSPNLGWLSFQPSDAASCGGGASALVDSNGNLVGQVSGYARVVSEIGRTDGWDGCVSLGNITSGSNQYSPTADSNTFTGSDNNTYLKGGVTYSVLTQFFKGFAWSNSVLGWLVFENPFPSSSVHVTTNFPPGVPDFSVTGNQVTIPVTGSIDTTATINRLGSDPTTQSIGEAIVNLPSGVTATITNNPSTCVLSGTNVSCTVNIHLVSSGATPGTYSNTFVVGNRSAPTALSHNDKLVITVSAPSPAPVGLYIGTTVAAIDAQATKPTSLMIKKGNPFALEWNINLDPAKYSCITHINKGSWNSWSSLDLSSYVTGQPQTGSLGLTSSDTNANTATTYNFLISCQSTDVNYAPQSAAASLILQSSSESEI